jgi:hypothetical protein
MQQPTPHRNNNYAERGASFCRTAESVMQVHMSKLRSSAKLAPTCRNDFTFGTSKAAHKNLTTNHGKFACHTLANNPHYELERGNPGAFTFKPVDIFSRARPLDRAP